MYTSWRFFCIDARVFMIVSYMPVCFEIYVNSG